MKASPLITLSSDFEKQSYGCGAMEGVIYEINPKARVLHYHHDIPAFNITEAAWSMESLITMPVGIHVCVVDPGVGTRRRATVIQTKRGDYLVGPDNGLFRPAAERLGGIQSVHELTNRKLMRPEVSAIFHGRDIFAPAAAHLSRGVSPDRFGPRIKEGELVAAPFREARIGKDQIQARLIHINSHGSLFFNILQEAWEGFVPLNEKVTLHGGGFSLKATHVRTFGEVPIGSPCILKDEFCRIQAAINQGSLLEQFPLKIGDPVGIGVRIISILGGASSKTTEPA